MHRTAVLMSILAAVATIATPCRATSATLTIIDTMDSVTVGFSDWLTGPSITHTSFGGEDDVEISGTYVTTNPPAGGTGEAFLFEPGTLTGTNTAFIRDHLTSAWSSDDSVASVILRFGSDCEPQCFGGFASLDHGKFADGTVQLISDYLSVAAGLQVFIQSDVASVPEPGTWLLVGPALLGLLCYGWRRKRAA